MTLADLNSSRNGLWLARNIEKAFDKLKLGLSFVPQDILHPLTLKMVAWDDAVRETPIWDTNSDVIGQYEGCPLHLDGHNPFRRALSYQAYMAHNHYLKKPLPIDKDPCLPEFGTPPPAFFAMRMSLRAQFENSLREEILQVTTFGEETWRGRFLHSTY